MPTVKKTASQSDVHLRRCVSQKRHGVGIRVRPFMFRFSLVPAGIFSLYRETEQTRLALARKKRRRRRLGFQQKINTFYQKLQRMKRSDKCCDGGAIVIVDAL